MRLALLFAATVLLATGAGSLMAGKRGLVMGVANDRSIAWGIARACAAQGAEIAFTYQGEALEKRVRPLAESVGGRLVLPCDVTDEASVDAVFETLSRAWGGRLDFLVHAIALPTSSWEPRSSAEVGPQFASALADVTSAAASTIVADTIPAPMRAPRGYRLRAMSNFMISLVPA